MLRDFHCHYRYLPVGCGCMWLLFFIASAFTILSILSWNFQVVNQLTCPPWLLSAVSLIDQIKIYSNLYMFTNLGYRSRRRCALDAFQLSRDLRYPLFHCLCYQRISKVYLKYIFSCYWNCCTLEWQVFCHATDAYINIGSNKKRKFKSLCWFLLN